MARARADGTPGYRRDMAVIEFDPPHRFVAGTVGPPGERQFYLQVTDDGRTTSVGLEKQQVQVLIERIDDILDGFVPVGDAVAEEQHDDAPLETPVDEEFRVGTMGLAWDPERERLVIECHAVGDSYDSPDVLEQVEAGESEIPAEDDPTQLVLRVVLEPLTARAFVRRAGKVVTAGRPACPFCAGPVDPEGHICPRANGFRR